MQPSVWRDDRATAVRDIEGVLEQNAAADIVQNLQIVHEFAAGLRVVQSGQHKRVEELLNPEIALEMDVKELLKLFLQSFRAPGLSE